MSHALTLLVAPVIMEANEGSGVSGLLEEKDLLAIAQLMGTDAGVLKPMVAHIRCHGSNELAQQKQEMILEMAQQKKEIISETMVLMESYFGPKFNALSERFGSLEEKLIPHEAMEIVEDRVDDLEDHVDGLEKTVGFHTQQIDELKKAQ